MSNEVFSECSALKSIEIPSSVKYIGDSAFCGCINLSTIRFLGKVEQLGFYDDDDIRSVMVDLFGYCESLSKIIVPSKMKDYYVELLDGVGYKDKIIEQDAEM